MHAIWPCAMTTEQQNESLTLRVFSRSTCAKPRFRGLQLLSSNLQLHNGEGLTKRQRNACGIQAQVLNVKSAEDDNASGGSTADCLTARTIRLLRETHTPASPHSTLNPA